MTSKLTREQAEDTIEGLEGLISRGVQSVHLDIAIAGMRQLIAAMDSEPVAWRYRYHEGLAPSNWRYVDCESECISAPNYQVQALYRHAQPEPELKPVGYLFVSDQGAVAYSPTNWGAPGLRLIGQIYGDMNVELQSAPVVPVVPATLPCSVELKPGLIIGKGCKTETLLTALRRRADYNADIDAMTPEERAEYDANIEAFKAMLPQPAPVVLDDTKLRELFDSWFASDCSFDLSPEASEADNIAWRESYWYVWQRCRAAMLQAGNSPVIPDGYVMVPKEPTEDMIVEGFESWPDEDFSEPGVWEEYQNMSGCQQAAHRARLCWAAMLAASQKEVK